MSLQGDLGEEGPKGEPGEKVCEEFLFSFVYVLDAAQGTNREAVGGQKTVKKS